MKTALADGLYAVVQPTWVAGLVVESGRVTMCAPILRRRLAHWLTVARAVEQRAACECGHPWSRHTQDEREPEWLHCRSCDRPCWNE